jgi:hypothetical protein
MENIGWKEGEWPDLISELQCGSPRLCRLRPASVGSEVNKHLKCTSAYGTYGIPKLSSIMDH